MEIESGPVSPDTIARGHESSALGLRGIINFVVIFVIAIVLINAVVWGIFKTIANFDQSKDIAPSALVASRVMSPEPRLQPSIGHPTLDREDLSDMHRAENAQFDKRGWTVDPRTNRPKLPDDVVSRVIAAAMQPAPSTSPTEGGAQ